MPLWLAPLFILPGLALYRRYSYLLGSSLVLLVLLTGVIEGWMKRPEPGGPVTVEGLQVLWVGIFIVAGIERGWLDDSRQGMALLGTAFLLGVLLYYALFPYILATGTLPAYLITLLLFTGLPLASGLVWRHSGGAPK
jgi:hypothetical protein